MCAFTLFVNITNINYCFTKISELLSLLCTLLYILLYYNTVISQIRSDILSTILSSLNVFLLYIWCQAMCQLFVTEEFDFRLSSFLHSRYPNPSYVHKYSLLLKCWNVLKLSEGFSHRVYFSYV